MKEKNMTSKGLRTLTVIGLIFLLCIFYKSIHKGNLLTSQPNPYPFPNIILKDIYGEEILRPAIFQENFNIIHIWASWCESCVHEHDEWVKIKKEWSYPLMSVVFRDNPERVQRLLAQKGNPYTLVFNDDKGALGLGLGLVGTPETFVVDQNGMIRFHYVGPINREIFARDFIPVLENLHA